MEKHLDEFINLAETCSFHETADKFFISSSSLSKHMSSLEAELDVSLFNRSTRNVSLSATGEIFYEYAKQMAALRDECLAALAQANPVNSNLLNIGAAPFLNYYNLRAILEQFEQYYPDAELCLIERSDPELKDSFAKEKLRYCFTTSPQIYDDAVQQVFREDILVAVVSKDNPLAEFPELTIHQLKNEKFIIHTPSPNQPVQFDHGPFWAFCQCINYKPRITAEVGFNSAIMKLVARNTGVAIMTNQQSHNVWLEGTVIIPLTPVHPYNLYVVSKKGVKHRAVEKAFMEFLSKWKEQPQESPKQADVIEDV